MSSDDEEIEEIEENFDESDCIDYDNTVLDSLESCLTEDVMSSVKQDSCCYFLEETENFSERLISYAKSVDIELSPGCLANTINNFCNAVLFSHSTNMSKNDIYAIVDVFLRQRHEILHSLSMKSLNLPMINSDQKFSDIFPGFPSDKTPDRIIIRDTDVIIIETTATLNVFKSYIGKGKIEEGFRSKYENEINRLRDDGYQVHYIVLSFDVKNPVNDSYTADLKKAAQLLNTVVDEEVRSKLEMSRLVFCNYSQNITKKYSSEVTNLLSENFCLEKPDLEIDFLIKDGPTTLPKYKRVAVSSFVYNKVINAWPRFPMMLERSLMDYTGKVSPFLDHSNNKFYFDRNNHGILYDDMMLVLINDDKPLFCKLLVQLFDGRPFNSDRADIEFFDTSKGDVVFKDSDCKLDQSIHFNSSPWNKEEKTGDYQDFVRVEYYLNKHHLYEDPGYEAKLKENFTEFFNKINTEEDFGKFCDKLSKKPFSSFELSEETVKLAVKKFDMEMHRLNSNQDNKPIIRYQKQPFLLPLMDTNDVNYIDYRDRPTEALEAFKRAPKLEYTQQIFNSIYRDDFVWGTRQEGENADITKVLFEIRETNSKIYKKQISYMREMGELKIPKLKNIPGIDDLKLKISDLNKQLNYLKGGKKDKLSVVRISCKGKSRFKDSFKEEMAHYKSKKSSSHYKGVGFIDSLMLSTDFNNLKYNLLSTSGKTCQDNILDTFVSDDVTLLKQLKMDYVRTNIDRLNHLKNTNLYHSCAFVSRLCHTLAFHSQSSMGSDYVAVDNLGFDKTIIMIRGGKKVFKTKKSKLFRLIYPIHTSITHWYSSPNFSCSTSIFKYNGLDYAITPWHTLDEVIMNDGLTFLHRCMSYVLLCHEPIIELALEKCFFNVMLSFHARRKTEELLHNLRYVCVNSISNISRLDLMFSELAGFNYDFFQCFLRSCLSKNFFQFSLILIEYNNKEKVSKTYFSDVGLKNLFDDSPIDNLEDLTMTIYSTFLMSKSPTNQQLEQTKNLTNMLKTWDLHNKQSSDNVATQYEINNFCIEEDGLVDYWNNLFISDFNYDSKFVVVLGKFSADYLSNIIDQSEINAKWLNIVNKNWDEFANTKGLRGMDDEKFFNRKGYYIVYNELLKDANYVSEIKNLLLSDDDEYKKRKLLKKMNRIYKDKLGCKNMKEAIFHVVDKKQRGGSREIFVMDLETKINQQAIEKMLAFICSKIPNEAISVPSNKRLQHIHANVFEKFQRSEGECYNMTLDCRKWAPHSIINKFIDMILSMSGYLPESFVTHFLIFFSKMFHKKVYTRSSIHKILNSNEGNKELMKALKEDKPKSGHYMEMSYSWIMGIFNYMSSFMHVMNQIYASHLIMNVTLNSSGKHCHYHMNAHSDDSGGKMQVSSKLEMKKTFFLYELMLKSCNHLLSDKKCNISKRYFEFLSVLYISNTLLSLISKISGSFNFHPTDTGYCGDINECYGKCIEMISSGATFDVAYLSMKISSHLVHKFYFNSDPVSTDYNIPPQLLGMPDCHPIMALISGSDSDVIRLTHDNTNNFDKFIFLSNLFNKNKELNSDIIKPIIATPFIRPTDELKEHIDLIGIDELNDNLKWVIKNFDSKNSALQTLKYGLLLKDQKFVSALIDENLTRRISRAYYFRSAKVCSTPWGLSTYKGLRTAIKMFNTEMPLDMLDPLLTNSILELQSDFKNYIESGSNFNLYEIMNYEVYAFVRNINSITYSTNDILTNHKTCKPMHINMQKTNLPTASNFNPATLCVWISFPEYRWMINMGDDYMNKYMQLDNYLKRHDIEISEVDSNWLYNLLQKMKSKFVKEYFIYSNVPHDVRDISNYKDFLIFLAHNSFKNKVVNGITMPMGDRITNPMHMIFQNQFNEDLMNVLTFINYCFSICTDFKLFQEIRKLQIDPTLLKCKSTSFYHLLHELHDKWELDVDNNYLVVPHLKSLIAHTNSELNAAPWLEESYYYSFVNRQKLVGNVWLGKGVLHINCPDIRMELHLTSNKIDKIITDKNKAVLKTQTIGYINSVLINANLPKIEDTFEKIDLSKWESFSIGLNNSGFICIDQCRNLKLCHPKFEFKIKIMNSCSNPGLCEVKINKNFSYTFLERNEIFGDKKTTVNVLKITPSETYNVLTKIYDNQKNREIVEGMGENFNKYFKMFIGVVSDIELSVTSDQLFDMCRSTKIYSIISELARFDEFTPSMLSNRKHVYPGQEGGLLDMLIKYKQRHPEFAFNPDIVLSPEMMSLKSSQPESFITNLITNIKLKYNTLYTGSDKTSIKREIFRISNIIDSDEYKSKLLSVLTTWGYIGVMGAIDEINFVKKVENFKGIRNYTNNPQYSYFNLNIFRKFINSLLLSTKKLNYFNQFVNKPPFFISKSYEDLLKCIISFVHTRVLSSYNTNVKVLSYVTDIDFIKLSNSIKNLLDIDGFEQDLQDNLQDHPMLSLLPIDKSNFKNIMIMLETLANSIVMSGKVNNVLDFHKAIQHDHDLIQPYVMTKRIVDETIAGYNMRASIHHGFMSGENYKNLYKHKLIKLDDCYYDIVTKRGEFSELSLPFSKYIYIKNKLKEEIDEDNDDYYDISIELNGTDPDVETLQEMLPDVLAGNYTRFSRVRDRGFLIRANHISADVFILPDLKGHMGIMDLIRNSSTTIVIVTNNYIEDLVELQTDKVQIFHSINQTWKNKSLIDPECILYYILDTFKINIKMWEKFFDVKHVDKNELMSLKNSLPTNFIMTEKGEIQHTSKYASLEDKVKMVNEYDKKEVIDDSTISSESEEAVKFFQDDRLNELLDKGFDVDFINIIKDYMKKIKVTEGDFFQKLIAKYIDSKKLADMVKNKTKSGTEDVINNLSDVNKATKIFEVASVFSVGVPSKSDVKNKSLSDKLIRAELNGLAKNAIDFILSGRLAISKRYKNIFHKHCRAMRRWALTEKRDVEKKLFMVDLAQLILNDAYEDEETNHDNLFSQIADFLTDKIISEEEESDYNFLDTYRKDADMGRLYYGWAHQ